MPATTMKDPRKAVLSMCMAALAMLASLASFHAHAAETAELKVRGSIRPPGCTPTLSAGGTADFGVIPLSTLNANRTTSLGQRTVAFTITCSARMTVALAASDNRRSSVISGAPGGAFGLGASQGINIGYYAINIRNLLADGASVSPLYYAPASGGGDIGFSDGTIIPLPGTPAGWRIGSGQISSSPQAFSNTTTPSAYRVISGSLVISATIDRSANLPISQDIPMDGSATIEVRYL